jgi:hypothetical protein
MRTAALVMSLMVLAPLGARAQSYVGPENCKACHEDAYATWKQGPHARSMASLPGKSAQDGRCLTCHAPQADKGILAVTCESCHGAGQYYAPGYVMKDSELARSVGLEDPSEKSCKTCHDGSSPSLKPFNFKEKLKAIDHWSGPKKGKQTQREVHNLLRDALGMVGAEKPAGHP